MKPLFTAFAIFLSFITVAQDLKVISWNIESGGAKIETITSLLADGQNSYYKNIGVWGFSEVQNKTWAYEIKNQLTDQTGNAHWFELGHSGSSDKLMVVYDKTKYEGIDRYELDHINVSGTVRAPLVVHLKEKKTDGAEFLFMVNHLYRGSASGRQKQSELLVEWVQEQKIPVIAVGDFNFDYSLKPNKPKGNKAFEIFVKNDHWSWVEPTDKKMTQCNTYYNSILDFVFVNDEAKKWAATSEIIIVPGDCPSDEKTPDHRPVTGIFTY